ncbi:acyltransferase [Rossellomorea marisflavi]|uniref:acyltransferase n=1 Tax=Rossellomorea marisflavi TaxID=189381 RepID=UPI00345DEFF9
MRKAYSLFCWILSFFYSKNLINQCQRFKVKTLYYSQRRYYNRKLKSSGENIAIHEPNTIKGIQYISIGDNFKAGKYLIMEAWDLHNGIRFEPKVEIGNNVSIGMFCHIASINKIVIEDDVLIAGKVFISDHSHGKTTREELGTPPNQRTLYSKGEIHIKKNVWVGENVSIMPGVTIGENSIIGANSVVTRNIPSNSIAFGCPARVAVR